MVAALIERFDLDDRSAEIVADPDGHRRFAIIDEHPANVAVAGQKVIRPFAALGIEAADAVGKCIDLPGLAGADAIDPVTVNLLRAQIKAELLAHHPGEEAADRVLLPIGGAHMAAIVAPSGRPSMASTRACFDPGRPSREEPALVFALPV